MKSAQVDPPAPLGAAFGKRAKVEERDSAGQEAGRGHEVDENGSSGEFWEKLVQMVLGSQLGSLAAGIRLAEAEDIKQEEEKEKEVCPKGTTDLSEAENDLSAVMQRQLFKYIERENDGDGTSAGNGSMCRDNEMTQWAPSRPLSFCDEVETAFGKGLLTFKDMAVYFSKEEWALLRPDEKALHREVMEENCKNLASLVLPILRFALISRQEKGNDLARSVKEGDKSAREGRESKKLGKSQRMKMKEKPKWQNTSVSFKGSQFYEISIHEKGCERDKNNIYNKEKRLECPECKKSFCQQLYFTINQPIHTGKKPSKYSKCRKSLIHSKGLKAHERIHGEKLYKCTECGKDFRCDIRLTILESVHKEQKTFKCLQCGRNFSDSRALNLHQRTYSGEKHHNFLECGKSLQKLTDLQNIHTGRKLHTCSVCGKSFGYKSKLEGHQKIHTQMKNYQCSECEKSFSQNARLKFHQKLHVQEKLNKSCVCGKSCSRSKHFNRHQRIHTGEKLYKCSECGKHFSWNSALRRHQSIHTGERPYTCSECGNGFRRRYQLHEHRRIHTGEKPYKCSECGKTFSWSLVLKTHQKIHTGEKPYSCSACGNSFRRKCQLHEHQRIHTGEKPYECSECGKSFTWSTALRRHQSIHTGEKPYASSKCGNSFRG